MNKPLNTKLYEKQKTDEFKKYESPVKSELKLNLENKPKNTPEKKFSAGSIIVTVWNNSVIDEKTGNENYYKTVSFDRRYLNKQGEWKTSNSLRLNDLPKAVLALNKAYEYLVLKEKETVEYDLSFDSAIDL